MLNKPPVFVGVVGTSGAGKDTLASYLVEKHDFVHVSMGDLIADYIRKNGLGGTDRARLQEIGNKLREEQGGDYWMKKALEGNFPRIVVSGLRTEAEAELLRKSGGIIIGLDAPSETRYKRSAVRKSEKDNVSYEEFVRLDEKELRNDNPSSQNILAVRAMANYVLDNSGSKEDMYKLTDDIICRYL